MLHITENPVKILRVQKGLMDYHPDPFAVPHDVIFSMLQ